jgi:long-subunit acyl-CoA synthetase (AMP-forming)
MSGVGTTESSAGISIFPLDKKRDLSGSSGKLYPGITARVERPDGSLAEFDELGELVVKTPSLALGYANNPDACVIGHRLSHLRTNVMFAARERPLSMGKWI